MEKDIVYLENLVLEKNKLIEDLTQIIVEREARIDELEEVMWDIKEITLKAL